MRQECDIFIDQELAGIVGDVVDEVEREYRASILQRCNLRLTDEIVLEIVSICKKGNPNSSLKQFELVYDVLHYFLVASKTRWASIRATYIQNNWAGCSRKYLVSLNFLRSIGIFERDTKKFSTIPKRKSMKMEHARTLVISPYWWDKLLTLNRDGGPKTPNNPYGFQEHLQKIFHDLDRKSQTLLATGLPRDLKDKLKGKRPIVSSTQPRDCGMGMLPHLLNLRHGVKTDWWLQFGTKDR